ncbi:hypothetical protein E5345_03840 [Propionibacterium sp. NM47_B9-13]|nr:hypothetical protein E5345_03840 [Propionibacterium sp. NM47_B9-13]
MASDLRALIVVQFSAQRWPRDAGGLRNVQGVATAAVMVRQHMCQATVFPNQSSSSENYA